jgi:hypothetical protein
MNVYRQLKLRRDLEANIPTLATGEPFFATDTKTLWIGSASGNVKANLSYAPATPTDWAASPPNNIISALDRLAHAVKLLGGNP